MTAPLDSFISLPYAFERPTPPFEGNDIRYPESLPRHFINALSKPGQKVFDPFAGLGTTLFVAETLDRTPYGTETDRDRFEWVAGQLENWMHLRNADAAKASTLGFPKMDMLMTSPPFMAASHTWNPLAGKASGYDAYLKKMALIFKNIAPLMKRGAHIVVQLDNIEGKTYTPLIRDVGAAIARTFRQTGEVVVAWDNSPLEYPHTHCLIFKA